MTTETILTINARTDKTFENRASLRSCFINDHIFSFKKKIWSLIKVFPLGVRKYHPELSGGSGDEQI